ncbi:MAG: hypothetical protein K2N26_02485, partial [Oscillospiraceae bacterium]|nr:hypothetical protein [Oscillospiraceae bacterium]
MLYHILSSLLYSRSETFFDIVFNSFREGFSTECGKLGGKFTTFHLKLVILHHCNDIIHQQ